MLAESGVDVTQRLNRIESTVEWIQSSLLEAAENGELRQHELVERLSELKDEVGRNNKILKELRNRGCAKCLQNRFGVFFVAVLLIIVWLLAVRNWVLQT